MSIKDLLRKENLWEFAAYAISKGYSMVDTKDPIEVLRMEHNGRLPVLIVFANKKVRDFFTVGQVNAEFVQEWLNQRGTPYREKPNACIPMFDSQFSQASAKLAQFMETSEEVKLDPMLGMSLQIAILVLRNKL